MSKLWNFFKPWPVLITRPVGDFISATVGLALTVIGLVLIGGSLLFLFIVIYHFLHEVVLVKHSFYSTLINVVNFLIFCYFVLIGFRGCDLWVKKVAVPAVLWVEEDPEESSSEK